MTIDYGALIASLDDNYGIVIEKEQMNPEYWCWSIDFNSIGFAGFITSEAAADSAAQYLGLDMTSY